MKNISFFTILLFSLIGLFGCAGLQQATMEPPVVSLQSFNVLPQSGMTPQFEITLSIVNPNSEALDLEGIYYTVDVEGHRVLAGVSNELPVIPGYGQESVKLIAVVDLLSGINLFSSLFTSPRDSFSYSFNADLDPGGFSPKIKLSEEGSFKLSGNVRN